VYDFHLDSAFELSRARFVASFSGTQFGVKRWRAGRPFREECCVAAPHAKKLAKQTMA
jgi:hypothetical protein